MKKLIGHILGTMVILVLSFCTVAFCRGLSNIRTWANSGQFYYDAFGPRGVDGCTDINGEVGHSLSLNGPTADCEPSGQWNCQIRVASGTLPPGISIDDIGNITGIPTERGHWIVTMKVSNIQCNGEPTNMDYTQKLCFHITGTGKVIE